MSTPISQQSIFVIIPAYNEEQVIRAVVEDFLAYKYSIVVVDDGSFKNVKSQLSGLPAYVLRHPVNLGQGAALQTGIEFALLKHADYIITFDADGQHDPKDISKLLEVLIHENTDIVLGSRFMKGAIHNMPAKRRFLLQIARRLNFLFTGLMLTDAHNGLRAMTNKAAKTIHFRENGMAHATEILSQIKKNKLHYAETPVTIRYSDYSKKKGQKLSGGFRIIFDILLNKIFK